MAIVIVAVLRWIEWKFLIPDFYFKLKFLFQILALVGQSSFVHNISIEDVCFGMWHCYHMIQGVVPGPWPSESQYSQKY